MVAVTFEFTDEQRKEYAGELLRTPDPFKAALIVFGDAEIGRVAYVAATWPSDIKVVRYQQEILGSKRVGEFLPTKEGILQTLDTWIKNDNFDIKERLSAIKLMADISGWIVKPEVTVPVNLNVTSNVMVVKDLGTNDDWEKKARDQQANLTKRDNEPAVTKH